MFFCISPLLSDNFLSLRLIAWDIWLKWVKVSCLSGRWLVDTIVWGCRKGGHNDVYIAEEITLRSVGGKEKNRARVLLPPSRECTQLPNILPLVPIFQRIHHFLIVPPTVKQTFCTGALRGHLMMTLDHFIPLNLVLWACLCFLTLNLSAERYTFPVNTIFCWVQTVPFFFSISPIKRVWHSYAANSGAVLT